MNTTLSRASYEIEIDRNVPVPMRDGTVLRADVYRPQAEGKFPVILERTQIWRGEGGGHQCPAKGKFFAPRGYVYVAQDIDQAYRFEVDMWATAQTFLPGHRLRVQVTSSDFPRYDRNLNTGGPFGEEVRGRVAVNTVFHDAMRPSHLVLPIAPLDPQW